MVRPAWIDHARDLRMRRKRIRDCRSSFALPLHPHAQCLETLQQNPGIEWRDRWSGLPDETLHIVLDEFFRPEHNATETAALSVDVLGRRIDNAIRAEFERDRKSTRLNSSHL